MSKIYANLTDEQRAAVSHKEGPLLVLAGAGTGKTRVITRRIAALVESGVSPERILAITFTNKAAQEMRERTEKLVGSAASLSTFHAFGARFLRRHCDEVELTRQFTIYDSADQLSVIKDAAEVADIDLQSWPAKILLAGISKAKNQLMSPQEVEEHALSPKARMIAKVYPVYEELMHSRNSVDFDDLLIMTHKVLAKHDEIRKRWASWYQYLLVDEYQDTNQVQYKIALSLAQEHRNLCVTGDPDQSIYGWRGADISNILNFEKAFPEARVVTLTKNFRSTQKILNAANKLIAFNVHRKEKSLTGVAGEGKAVQLKELFNNEEEATFVSRKIAEMRLQSVPLNEIAVLYRANYQSRLIEEALVHRGIPYQVVGAVAFYERKEVKDLLAYLKILVNRHDDYSSLRVINTPARRIGAATIKKLNQFRKKRRCTFFAAMNHLDEVGLGPRAKKSVAAWHDLMSELERYATAHNAADSLRQLIELTKYKAYLEKQDPEDTDRLENLLTLVDAAEEFDRDAAKKLASFQAQGRDDLTGDEVIPGVAGFLQHVSLVSAVDNMDGDRVSLMTIHTAKGLEFHSVFCLGLEDGVFPTSRALEDPAGPEEERRLAYVAMTRAKRVLTLTYSKMRSRFGRLENLEPSQFLYESELLQAPRRTEYSRPHRHTERTDWDSDSQVPPGWDGEELSHGWSRKRAKNSSQPKPNSKTITGAKKLTTSAHPKFIGSAFSKPRAATHERGKFSVGDTVNHEHFGQGKVNSVTGQGAGTRVRILFERFGEKVLVLQYARLTKVN